MLLEPAALLEGLGVEGLARPPMQEREHIIPIIPVGVAAGMSAGKKMGLSRAPRRW
jgi:hypothetical protein